MLSEKIIVIDQFECVLIKNIRGGSSVHCHVNIDTVDKITLQLTTKHIFAYGSTDQLATTMGQFNGTVSFRDNQHEMPIHVLTGNHGSLLSCKTVTALGIPNLHVRHVALCSMTNCP